jgi:multidrug efflux pump subunit AcrA (membrane-fusion protein)
MFRTEWKFFSLMVVLAMLLSACGSLGGAQPTPTPLPPLVSYERGVFTVEKGSIVSEKDLLGEIVPARQDQLFFRASGFVTRLTVKRGDFVKAGDVLAELQIDDLLAQLQQARIDLEVSQADLEKSFIQHEFDVKRAQSEVVVWEKRLELARLELDNSFGNALEAAKLNYDITEQNLLMAQESLALTEQATNPYTEQVVKRNQLSVQRLETLLSERQIVAPYDCVILRVNLRAGQSVEGYAPAFDVGDPSDLVVRAQFDFALRDKLVKSTEAYLYLTSDDTEGWPVEFLPNFLPIQQTENNLLPTADYFYFDVPADVSTDELPIGRSVFLTVILGRRDDALLLPPAAIREYKGLYFVIVQEGDRRRRVEINEVGLQSPDRWEIIADLEEGAQVVGP